MRSPTRAVSGSSRRRIDDTLADDPRGRGRRPRRAAGVGATQPGVLGDERLGLGGDLAEVVAQRPGEVGGGERLATGDPAGDPLGQRPVERVGDRRGAPRAPRATGPRSSRDVARSRCF